MFSILFNSKKKQLINSFKWKLYLHISNNYVYAIVINNFNKYNEIT